MDSDQEQIIQVINSVSEDDGSISTSCQLKGGVSRTTLDSQESHEPLMMDRPSVAGTSCPLLTSSSSDRSTDSTCDFSEGRRNLLDSRIMMKQRGLKCCAVTGLVTAVIWATLALSFPLIYHAVINYQMSLQPGTLQYKMWTESPVPIYLKFHLFNMTNSEEVMENKTKPILQELGPYTFEEKHIRVNVKHNDNGTVTFQTKRVWHFVPEMSRGNLLDNVTNLNVPLVGASYSLRHQPLWFKVAFNRIIKVLHSKFFVTKTVGELLFDGYKDPLLDLAQRLPAGTFPPLDKFGWYYSRNNSDTYDGLFNVYTGADGRIDRFGEMDRWNNASQSKFYDSYCGMINGSFSEGWAPRRNRSTISLFISDLCRTVTLDYEGDVLNAGVSSYRFAGTQRVFANGSDPYPETGCFCSGGVCNPSGVGNSSTCKYNLPMFVSFPHYYLADPYYANMVEGMTPKEDIHKFHIDLEPELGVPTKVRARLQVNFLVEPDADIDVMESAKRMYVPMVWFEINADVPSDLGWWLNVALAVPIAGTATFFALVCLSVVAVAVSGIILVKRRSGTHPIASVIQTISGHDGPNSSGSRKNRTEST